MKSLSNRRTLQVAATSKSSSLVSLTDYGKCHTGSISPQAVLQDGSLRCNVTSRIDGHVSIQHMTEAGDKTSRPGRILAAEPSGWTVIRLDDQTVQRCDPTGFSSCLQLPALSESLQIAAINGLGHVVGTLNASNGDQVGLLWLSGKPELLGASARTAEAINNNEQVVGLTQAGDLYAWTSQTGLRVVPTDSYQVWINGLSNSGTMVGVVYRTCQQMTGFRWSTDEGWREVPSGHGLSSCLVGITDTGWAYGYSTLHDGTFAHFFWDGGPTTHLAEPLLFAPDSGWKLESLQVSNSLDKFSGLARAQDGVHAFVAHLKLPQSVRDVKGHATTD